MHDRNHIVSAPITIVLEWRNATVQAMNEYSHQLPYCSFFRLITLQWAHREVSCLELIH